MGNTIIPLRSYTEARKAVRILAGNGIRASVTKTGTGRYGCTFGIRTSEPPALVCAILAGAGIRCGDRMPFPPHEPGQPRPPRPPRPPRR